MRLVTITALAVLIATPAFAASGKKKIHRHHSAHSHTSPYAQQSDMGRADPYVVRSFGGRRIVGRDPDPNIRQRLRDDDAFFRNEN